MHVDGGGLERLAAVLPFAARIETDALVATLLKENIDQIRAELAGRELRERTQG